MTIDSKLNQRLCLVNAALFSLTSVFPCSASVEPNWRTLGKQANIRLFEKRYRDSIEGFQKAIAALPPAENRDDVKLDLLLSQAEAYRLWGRYNECLGVLEDVKRELPTGVAKDPTLAARYWRRRADLLISLKQYNEAVEAFRQQLIVILKFFHPTSEHFLYVSEELCNKLIFANQPKLLAEFLKKDVLNRIPQEGGFRKTVEDRFIKSFDAIRAESWLLTNQGHLSKAKQLLFTLQDIEPYKKDIAARWLNWISTCSSHNERGQLTDDVSDRLLALVKYFKAHPTVENLHQKVICHEALEYMYRETRQVELEELQKNALIGAIEELLPNNASSQERIVLLAKLNTLSSTEIRVDLKSPLALSLMRRSVKYSEMPAQGIDSSNLKAYLGFHVMGRIRLARHCGRMGLFTEAENSIASIDRNAIAVSPLRVDDTHIKLAEFYIDRGKFKDAERHIRETEATTKSLGTMAKLQELKELLAKEKLRY
ncbi:MAG: hypothetical protein K2X93_03375 [Candidatus Obscuribacterales bacterium]|nr:hypothetical protein [Candidatus Obscuribacterales bacterium]